MSEIIINPISGSIGAEIHGVNLSTDLSDAVFSEIRQTFIDHGLIFFRNQELTPDDHLRFAKRWGEININRFFAKVEGYEQIAEVKKDPDQEINIGGAWHTDHHMTRSLQWVPFYWLGKHPKQVVTLFLLICIELMKAFLMD